MYNFAQTLLVFLMIHFRGMSLKEASTVFTRNAELSVLTTRYIPKYHIAKDENICFLGEFDLTMQLPYTLDIWNKTLPSYIVLEVLNATVDRQKSVCDSTRAHLVLEWTPGSASHSWLIEFVFAKAEDIIETQKFFYLRKMAVNYYVEEKIFSDTTVEGWKRLQATGLEEYMTLVDMHYTCRGPKKISLDNQTIGFDVAEATFTNLTFQAFMNSRDETFKGMPFHCDDDVAVSSVLPIVTGVTLLAVLGLALVVFFVFRRSRLKRGQRLLK